MELFSHQTEGIAFLKKKKKAILADEMGTGKSRQAICAAGEEGKGVLVICPASLKINWQREIMMVYPEDISTIMTTTGGKWYEPLSSVAWFIVNYDILEKKKDDILMLIKEGFVGTVILDEAHYIKGRRTIRSDAALEITKQASRVYLLTGTPIMNRPAELFNLLRAIDHPIAKLKTTFTQKYCGGQLKTLVRDLVQNRSFFVDPKKSFAFRHNKDRYKVFTYSDNTGATNLDELRELTKDVILRRLKKDVLDLPPKIISTQICELDKEQKEKYHSAWDDYVKWVAENPEGKNLDNIMMAQQLVEIGKLKQVCSLAKIKTIKEDVVNAIEQGQKVIIFTQYKQTVDHLYQELKEAEAVTLTGADDMDQKQKAIDAFQNDDKVKVMIANIKAGGVGLTLTAASIVMFADMDWSPAIHQQAEDRAHRNGQTGTVNVYYYVTKDTIEEDIMEVLDDKRGIIGQVVDGKEAEGGATKDILKKIRNRVINSDH